MTPPLAVGDAVTLVTRLQPPARVLLTLAGVVESIDGDRATVRWADGARSSARLQFLRAVLEPGLAEAITQSADRADLRRYPAPRVEPGVLLALSTPGSALARRGVSSGWVHLVADGAAGPDDDRPRMAPSELED